MAYLYLLMVVWVVLQVFWTANPSASWWSSCGQCRLLSYACYYCLSYVSSRMSVWYLYVLLHNSTETGYGLGEREVCVRVSVDLKMFTFPYRPVWLRGPTNLLSNGHRRLFPRLKAAEAWSWPLTFNLCRGKENLDLRVSIHNFRD
jgi:hypothetical protein